MLYNSAHELSIANSSRGGNIIVLTSADQYRYVNASSVANYIKGDIMPVRDMRGDGSWKILKYEDPIFLKEAYLERCYWTRGPSYLDGGDLKSPPSKYVNSSQLNAIRLQGYPPPSIIPAPCYITVDSLNALLSRGTVTDVPSSGLTTDLLTEGLGRLALKRVEFQPVDFQSGGPLSADNIRTMFHNVRLARASLCAQIVQNVFGSMSYIAKSYTWGDRDPVYPNDVAGTTSGTIYHAVQLAARLETSQYWEITFPSEGPTISQFGNLSYSYAIRAVLFVELSGYRQDTSSTRYDVLVLPCTIQGSSPEDLIVKAPPISQYVPRIVQNFGIPYVTSAQQLGDGPGGSVSIGSAMFAIVHDFPSDFDDSDWGWTPPA